MTKKVLIGLILIVCFLVPQGFTDTLLSPYPIPKFKKGTPSLHSDFFVDHIWEQVERPLHLKKLFKKVLFLKDRAKNANADGSVSDSGFFENRLGVKNISPNDMKQGNITDGGPDLSGGLTIIKAKSDGMNTGFIVEDKRGHRYILKFDPQSYPELTTGAEIIGARFLHAFGYHVPEYSLSFIRPNQLKVKEGVEYYDETGFKKPLTTQNLEWVLRNSYINVEGEYRASASRFIEGKIIGPMSFEGRRNNDPKDTINHENRRELRGLRVFCSFLNHFDLRRSNTLDVVVEDQDGWYMKHYLLDFTATLGAYIQGPKDPWIGQEYAVDGVEVLKSILSLGFYKRPWEELDRPHPQTGYFTNEDFSPAKWRTHIPNYAFQAMKTEDAIWAAKILQNLTDDQIAAAVSAGQISSDSAEKDLIQKLIARRDIIVNYWLSKE